MTVQHDNVLSTIDSTDLGAVTGGQNAWSPAAAPAQAWSSEKAATPAWSGQTAQPAAAWSGAAWNPKSAW